MLFQHYTPYATAAAEKVRLECPHLERTNVPRIDGIVYECCLSCGQATRSGRVKSVGVMHSDLYSWHLKDENIIWNT